MIITINENELDKYDERAKRIIKELIDPELGYAPYFVNSFYNDVILPQVIINDILKEYKNEKIITLIVPGIGLKLHIRNNDAKEAMESARGYMYSKEFI